MCVFVFKLSVQKSQLSTGTKCKIFHELNVYENKCYFYFKLSKWLYLFVLNCFSVNYVIFGMLCHFKIMFHFCGKCFISNNQ